MANKKKQITKKKKAVTRKKSNLSQPNDLKKQPTSKTGTKKRATKADHSEQVTLKLKREPYFATYIYVVDLPGGVQISAGLATRIFNLRAKDPKGIVKSNFKRLGAWHSVDNLEKQDEFDEISAYILASAQEVFNNLGYRKNTHPIITNMWANISPRYAFNQVHTHPGSIWSGVYYVQAPPDSGKIFFLDPRPQASVINILYEKNQRKKTEVLSRIFFAPKVGRLLLFPSWLQHEVQPNLSKLEGEQGERISISFNIRQSSSNNSKK